MIDVRWREALWRDEVFHSLNMSYARQSGVLRFIVVVGTTYTLTLVAKAVAHANAGRFGDGNDMNCCVEKDTENEKRSLQDAHYEMFTEAPLHEDHGWHPHQDRTSPTDHSPESTHMHYRHSYNNAYDHKNDDSDYDSRDKNSDDEKDDEDKDDGKNDSKRNSRGSSSSDQNFQSSVLTDLDGINIGNTITIVNIGTASPQPGNNGPSDSKSNGNVLAPGDAGSVALTSAARAFCDSVGCNSSQESPSIDANSSAMILPPTTFSVASSNATRDNNVRCGPTVSNGSSRVTIGLVKWLLLVAIVMELFRF